MNDFLTIGGKTLRSRLFVGTGKYKDMAETRAAIEASGADVVTGPVAPHPHVVGIVLARYRAALEA